MGYLLMVVGTVWVIALTLMGAIDAQWEFIKGPLQTLALLVVALIFVIFLGVLVVRVGLHGLPSAGDRLAARACVASGLGRPA